MGFEVLIFALAGIQHTWPGSNKHTNRILKDLQIQIGNRDHQTVVQSWAQSFPLHATSVWLQLSPSPQRKKEKGGSQTERERESWGRNWKIWMKTKECWKWKIELKDKDGDGAIIQGWRRKKARKEEMFFSLLLTWCQPRLSGLEKHIRDLFALWE